MHSTNDYHRAESSRATAEWTGEWERISIENVLYVFSVLATECEYDFVSSNVSNIFVRVTSNFEAMLDEMKLIWNYCLRVARQYFYTHTCALAAVFLFLSLSLSRFRSARNAHEFCVRRIIIFGSCCYFNAIKSRPVYFPHYIPIAISLSGDGGDGGGGNKQSQSSNLYIDHRKAKCVQINPTNFYKYAFTVMEVVSERIVLSEKRNLTMATAQSQAIQRKWFYSDYTFDDIYVHGKGFAYSLWPQRFKRYSVWVLLLGRSSCT